MYVSVAMVSKCYRRVIFSSPLLFYLSLIFNTHYVGCKSLVSDKSIDVGYFWHVTDLHWDPSYAETGSSAPGVSCGQNAPSDIDQLGDYGDYACDSPWTLINSSLYAMKQIHADVDFIIWTGDDTPHNADISLTEVAALVGNITDKILECFPNTTTFPVLGNHDWSPKHQLPPRPDPFYDVIAELWSPWLRQIDPDVDAMFRKGGYYNASINSKLRLVGLNTNLYYRNNQITDTMPDPACQFQWLDDTLSDAADRALQVIIISHIPPGQFEKHNNTHWFRPPFNEIFLELLRKHHDVISSAHYGHHHSDSFRLVDNSEGEYVSSFLIAPAVTPWETTLPGVLGGAGNNPSIRLVHYDRQTGEVLDYEQYYMDLVAANSHQRTNWTLAYRFTDHYQLPDVKTASLKKLAERLWIDDQLFTKYYAVNDLFYETTSRSQWSQTERVVHCCSISNVSYENYEECIRKNAPGGTTDGQSAVLASTGLVVAMLTLIRIYNLF